MSLGRRCRHAQPVNEVASPPIRMTFHQLRKKEGAFLVNVRWPVGILAFGFVLLSIAGVVLCQSAATSSYAKCPTSDDDSSGGSAFVPPRAALIEPAVPAASAVAENPPDLLPIVPGIVALVAEAIGEERAPKNRSADISEERLNRPEPLVSELPMQNTAREPALSEVPINVSKEPTAPATLAKPAGCNGDFGTALKFARNPAEAAKLAKQDKKLAFFLHVSGNFEESGFT
jgi:hypothetical protein